MSTPQDRKVPQEGRIWQAAYAAALKSLSESSEFTESQRMALARAMAHVASVILPTFAENIEQSLPKNQNPSKD